MNIDTVATLETIARKYYERSTFIPDSYRAAYQLRQRQTWDQLPEYDREHYRRVVWPVVADTLYAVGFENISESSLPERDSAVG